MTITIDEDVSLVALYVAVEDFAGRVDIPAVDNLDENYCLRFQSWNVHPSDERPQLAQIADTEC